MKHDHHQQYPKYIRDAVDMGSITVRELGDLAELHGLKLLDVITL